MFKESDVGKKVIRSDGVIDTITEWDYDDTEWPVGVGDDIRGLTYYSASGECCISMFASISSLYTVNKIGSPDARKIVAMLAREYLKSNRAFTKYPLSSSVNRAEYFVIMLKTKQIYYQAKQLLGDTK